MIRLVVEPAPCRASEVIAGDEALLARGEPVVRVGTFGEIAVSLGVSQRDLSTHPWSSSEGPLPVVRRASGGTALLHLPGDLFWSVVLPRSDPLAGPGFVQRYGDLGAGWPLYLRGRKISASWACPPAAREEYCLLSARGKVLAAGGRVFGGASQHATGRALLHHGVVSATLRPDLLAELFRLPRELIASSLTSLEEEGARLGVAALPELGATLREGLGERH